MRRAFACQYVRDWRVANDTHRSHREALAQAEEAYACEQLIEGRRIPSTNSRKQHDQGCDEENRASAHAHRDRHPEQSTDTHEEGGSTDKRLDGPRVDILSGHLDQ